MSDKFCSTTKSVINSILCECGSVRSLSFNCLKNFCFYWTNFEEQAHLQNILFASFCYVFGLLLVFVLFFILFVSACNIHVPIKLKFLRIQNVLNVNKRNKTKKAEKSVVCMSFWVHFIKSSIELRKLISISASESKNRRIEKSKSNYSTI